jgi:thymidylate kinase
MPVNADTAETQSGRPVRGIRRWIQPAGLCVAILGPDGSGKSSVIEQYVRSMSPFFSATRKFHLRPYLFGASAGGGTPNTDPHGQTPRGSLASMVKALYLWADYGLGYYLRLYPLLAGSALVIFDRYYYDLLIDTRRFRYGGPRWLVGLIARLIPRPDMVLILDAPAEVLQARKQEVPVQESARQVEAYRALAKSATIRGRAVLVDASRPLEEVVRQCVDGTLALLAERAAKRSHTR